MKNRGKAIAFVLALITCFVLSACGKTPNVTTGGGNTLTTADNTQYYDSITSTLKLNRSYKGLNFLTDGIGVATVDAYTDGDTTRFVLADSNETIVVRYYSIDTKESTGDVEKWGKAASKFTKTQLEKAVEIVLEATDSRAKKDSYGSRYLGYVWYRTADSEDFKLLNLEIVENGFSDNTGINTDAFKYYKYFKEANDFAKSIKLRLWSDLDDPLYSTDPVPMTIKEFWHNTDAFYDSDNDVGSNVVLTAYLKSVTKSQSGTYTFVAEEYDEETGKTYSIDVYAAYDSSSSSTMKIGHLYTIYGSIQNHYGNFQISGINYQTIFDLPGYTRVIQKDYYLTFNSSTTFVTQYSQTLYTDATVVSSTTEGDYVMVVATASLRTLNGTKDEVVGYTFKVPTSYGYTFNVGDKFTCSAFQFEAGTKVLTVISKADISIKK